MSECNYCTLKKIKENALKDGASITIISAPMSEFKQGVDVYVTPKGKQLNRGDHSGQFAAWFSEIGEACSCNR